MAHAPNKPGEGVIFPNSDENPHPKAPGHRGRMTCPCCREELSISAWVNQAKSSGQRYLKLLCQRYVSGTGSNAPPQQHADQHNRDQQSLPY